MRLINVKEGNTVYIKYIAADNTEIDRLKALGIVCGSKLTVLYSDKRCGCIVAAGGDPTGLSRRLCERTEVE